MKPTDTGPTDPKPPARPAAIGRQDTRPVRNSELEAALSEVRALPPPPPARIEAAVVEALKLVREGQMKLLAAEALLLAAVRR